MEYQTWEQDVPQAITTDALWNMQVYRLALFVNDQAWQDVTALLRDRRTVATADQLYRAMGSVGANIAEGYSRGTGRDQARFFEYALGSARESRHWYFSARHILGDEVIAQRLELLARISRQLLAAIRSQRSRGVREIPAKYFTDDY